MKHLLLAVLLLTGLLAKGTNIDDDSKTSIKNQIINIIKNGSTGLDFPMGDMPPEMAVGKDAEDIAEYLASDKTGAAPKSIMVCSTCHGPKLKGFDGMSADISNLQDKERMICEIGNGEQYFKEAEKANNKKSMSLLEKACNCKHIKACQFLSVIYIKGLEDTPVDKERGVGYLEKLCNDGDGQSCQFSGIIYSEGRHEMKKDMTKAISYFEKGCELEDGKSCFLLAKVNYNGLYGVKENKEKGLGLLNKACSLGNEQACKDKNRIDFSKQFTPEQIKGINKAFKDVKIPK